MAGVVYGSDHTEKHFVRPSDWDRGIIHLFDGKGVVGRLFRWFGPHVVRRRSLSPIPLYGTGPDGPSSKAPGVIAHVLRKHRDYYQKGIKILIITPIAPHEITSDDGVDLPIYSYNGEGFEPLHHVRINMDIVRMFKPVNFVSAYIPDYGAIVFKSVNPDLLTGKTGAFQSELEKRLKLLIQAIDVASLALLSKATGAKASSIIQRKELQLRDAWARLKVKADELDQKTRYLRALGGVDHQQVEMEPVSVDDGVYAFLDMVGSVKALREIPPKAYFYILQFCHEIAAETAFSFGCRLDNFIGDSVFFEHVSVFDSPELENSPGLVERVMLMTMAVASVLNQIEQLKSGHHPMDPSASVHNLLKTAKVDVRFRAGMEYGNVTIGPLGSSNRRVITAIGSAVNTASRLEHTGKPGWIHVEPHVIDLLKSARVSPRTPWLRTLPFSSSFPWKEEGLPFFEMFKHHFRLEQQMILPNRPVAYKEFSRENTFLIACAPGPRPKDQSDSSLKFSA